MGSATHKSGLLLIISAPSGGGKTTLSQHLLAANPNTVRAVTCTTRAPREGEKDGVDYYFLDPGDFLKRVPAIWDDVKFIDGFPGQYVVIARRAGKTWYVAGINADRQQPRKVKIDLKSLGVTKQGTLSTDGIDFLGFKNEAFPLEKLATSDEITMRPRGGFVGREAGQRAQQPDRKSP